MSAAVPIRPERPEDEPAVRAVVGDAFGTDGEHVLDMLDALRASSAWVPGLSWVAERDGRVVGHVLLTRCGVLADSGVVDVLTLTPLAVAPDAQGNGVGTALVAHALARAAEDGWPLVLLEGSPRYYGPRGFEDAEPLGFPSPSHHIPPGAWQVALLPAHEPWMVGPCVLSAPLAAINDEPRF